VLAEKASLLRVARRIIVLIFFAAGCGGGGDRPGTPSLGSRLDVSGVIADHSLVYRFPRYPRRGTVKDLFNHIYFEGDTVCFSMALRGGAGPLKLRAEFNDPVSGKALEAERLETHGNRVYGFSLVGSILERFHEARLHRAIEAGEWRNRKVPFTLRITVQDRDGTTVREVTGSFRIDL